MTKDEQIKLLIEGVEAWNARRESDPFRPDLSGENIWKAFNDACKLEQIGDWLSIPLGGVNFSNANLKGANLMSACLVDANLVDANLKNAKLMSADLTGAFLARAKLQKAKFKNAKLANANLDFANLKSATFGYAHLKNTSLLGAILKKADLSNVEFLTDVDSAGAQPWKAKLYPFGKSDLSPKEYECELNAIKNVRDLLELIQKIQGHHKDDGTRLYFRGEAQNRTDWVLQPSVMREDELRRSEGEMLRDLMSRRPEEFNGRNSALEQWVLAQHHRLPTRFIDITRNPLVALFFACEDNKYKNQEGRLRIFAVPQTLIKPFTNDTISVIANLAKMTYLEQKLILGVETTDIRGAEKEEYDLAKLRLYQGIQQEKPYFKERIDVRDLYKVFVVEPQQFPERIRAQSGAFLASAFHDRFEPEKIQDWNKHIPVYAHYELTIPSDCKEGIRNELRLLNITEETLLPGLDSSAKAVKETYSNNKDKTIPKQIRTKYSKGALIPLAPVNLKEGDEVTLSIKDKPQL